MRLFAWLRPFSDPTYPRSRDLIRPRVAALPSQPLPTRRTWFTLSSFRFVFNQLRCPCLVGCYEGIENGAMAGGLALVVLGPLSPELPVAFGVVALETLLPKFLARLMRLLGCALVVAPLYEAIEFVLDPFASAYIHLTPLLLSFHCPRTRGQAQIPLAGSGYCYRPRPRPYIGIGTQGR